MCWLIGVTSPYEINGKNQRRSSFESFRVFFFFIVINIYVWSYGPKVPLCLFFFVAAVGEWHLIRNIADFSDDWNLCCIRMARMTQTAESAEAHFDIWRVKCRRNNGTMTVESKSVVW